MKHVRSVSTLLAALVLLAPAEASAAPGDRMTGSGTVSPGLTTTCTNQTLTFSGTVTSVDGKTYYLEFQGGSNGCATLWSETGSGTFSGDYSGSASYQRTGPLMRFDSATFSFVCGWFFTSFNPVTTYVLVCTEGVVLP